MIDVKQAVSNAIQYFLNLMGGADVLLEEVEPSDDERFWHVTLSAALPAPMDPASMGLAEALKAAALGSAKPRRVYKVLKVDAETGAVRSMKMRAAHD